MTICIATIVTGNQVGAKLVEDPEELWNAIEEIADQGDLHLCHQVAEYVGEPREDVAEFLRNLADAIENPEQ